ncbi:unnamed protein product [Nippostrongylus brasiliensis]|uniref:Uncharacterized protein n=1 Tax=Nippostrongylus brasiliensis TaxID=27835 RepID=A0A0N4YHZ4_NIPBR|nr:unnamed protein product [Nippostrongylus brasiliensis]
MYAHSCQYKSFVIANDEFNDDDVRPPFFIEEPLKCSALAAVGRPHDDRDVVDGTYEVVNTATPSSIIFNEPHKCVVLEMASIVSKSIYATTTSVRT